MGTCQIHTECEILCLMKRKAKYAQSKGKKPTTISNTSTSAWRPISIRTRDLDSITNAISYQYRHRVTNTTCFQEKMTASNILRENFESC